MAHILSAIPQLLVSSSETKIFAAEYNLIGWFKVHIIVRPFTLAQRDLTWTDDYPEDGAGKDIMALPIRQGERPRIRGIAPQRQSTQRPGPGMNKVSFDRPCCLIEAS
jgi:hypothetical protein